MQLAPSCYLSSTAAARPLIDLILANTGVCPTLPHLEQARSVWLDMFPSLVPPAADKEVSQRDWEGPLIEATKYLPLMMVAEPDYLRCLHLSLEHGYKRYQYHHWVYVWTMFQFGLVSPCGWASLYVPLMNAVIVVPLLPDWVYTVCHAKREARVFIVMLPLMISFDGHFHRLVFQLV